MLKHRLATIVVALCAAAGMLFAAGTAPAAGAAPRTSMAVTEMAKVILPETSINAPGFFSAVGTFEGIPFSHSVIAWTGTDAAHHLNVMTSADGLQYGHKITLNQTSISRPAVIQLGGGIGNEVILAWTGTDANRSLNVLFDVYGSRQKLTLRDNSFTAPALAFFNGKLLLAWTGTDANHSLNVMPISLPPMTAGPKSVLSRFSSDAWPNLANRFAANQNKIVLSWAARSRLLSFAESTNGSSFTPVLGDQAETSAFGPAYLNFETEGGPGDWIAWTGTDAAHHLNVKWTSKYPSWNGTKTVLGETAFGGPGLGFNAGMLIAWAGTDAAHHLNVARLTGF